MGEFEERPREEPTVVPFRGFESVDTAEWSALIEHGRLQGRIHAEQVTHVLRDVELTGEVLDSVRHICEDEGITLDETLDDADDCLLYTSPSPRDGLLSRMPSSA